ncbi:hypothetical protein BLS_006687 [Venturia inaequalis]|uniref:RNA polymerase II transcription factor B subunit 2 n=1 Tax=Venturia inaequalis TaxID=5025 RepID=A0A8H3VAZ2_VENIN|nr:hypothetical protein EG328_002157 [Venturia inaequalis]KAE9977810.1 hypothetical protein EG327_007624 [Venturia inaequalis]KAE9985604.1 hypothetical protein BLS_006687 [Venturia inaequalis]RDI88803.1 hypothetical protein Vi05172_g1586 [Venturia inaequalis]
MSAALLEYLEGLPGLAFKKLYEQPSTVLAVLRRMLPHLAKTIVMAMLYMPDPLLESDLHTWIKAESRRERDEAIATLERLHILTVVPEPATPRAYQLSPSFSVSLRRALTGGGNHKSFGIPCSKADPSKPTVQWLDQWAKTKWENILDFMVGSSGNMRSTAQLKKATIELLQLGHLVSTSNRITKEGFEFVLQEANTQVWSLLIVYLTASEDLGMDTVEVLSFLFMLGSLELGQDYGTASLTDTQIRMLENLGDFGIVYMHPGDSSRFYPTRLSTTLTSDAGALLISGDNSDVTESNAGKGGYIILETNHRLYAYTNSRLQTKILALFTKLHTRFPNLVSGILTKKSINEAIKLGITSDQIISYITTHAHPQMLKNTPVLPPTVVDQIRLWQLEENRMVCVKGVLMKEFSNQNHYKQTVKYAEEIGVLEWKDDKEMKFFVNDIQQLKVFMKRGGG